MSIFRKELAYDIYACLGFIAFYIVAYRDMLLEQIRFWALNLFPMPTSNLSYYVSGQFYWFSGNLGSPAQPNIAGWLPYIFVLISGGNLVLAEKFLASATLVSCFTMYFFLSNHFKGSRLARFSAALIYGFGPATVLDFSDIAFWGYVMIPVVFNYMFNLFEEKRRTKDALLLGLSISLMTAFLPQILSLILLSFLVFLVARMLANTEKLTYLRRVAVQFLLAMFVFVATSPYLISGSYQFLISIGHAYTSAVTSPSLPSIYQATYSNQGIATVLRLIGGSPGNHLSNDSWIGFVLPVLAFGSLLLIRNRKRMLDLLALSVVSLVVMTIIYGIHLESGWAMWLLNNTPVKLFFYPERPLYIVTFAYCVMISVTVSRLIAIVTRFHLSTRFRLSYSIPWFKSKHVFSALLTSSLLVSVFIFAPVFDVQMHQERYAPLPPVYSSIENWLLSHSKGETYRVMFLPTDSFFTVLGFPEAFEYTSGYALRQTSDYVDFVYNQMITKGTCYLGSLLAPASVKYIVLATPDPNTLWKGSPAMGAPLYPVINGPPTYTATGVTGNPLDIAEILDNQRDLKLVYVNQDFQVYENMMYLPEISVFSSATYVVGSEDVVPILPYMPGFGANNDLLILAGQNPSLAKELPEVSSSILFFNTDISSYANLLSSSIKSGSVYEDAMNALGSKKQLYLFAQDSQTLSQSITTPSGQWRFALRAPEPLVVNPSMGIIDLDQGQTFNITKENFKPAHNPPAYDFDLANYYFYTSAGGNFTITINGSGSLWAYVSYNSTLSNIGPQTPFYFGGPVENRTFDIYLPPNTSFQPMVNAYNPTMGQNITDNINEISIVNEIGGKYSILNVDGTNVTNAQNSDMNGWSIFGPVYLDSGAHHLAITNGIQRSYVAIYNTANLDDIFGDNASIDYSYSKLSETSYDVTINTDSSVFLSLSESYYPNWLASSDQRLMHFAAFSFSNGFYFNGSNSGLVNVKVEYDPPLLNQVYVVQQILFVTTVLLLGASFVVRKVQRKIRDLYKK
jgi:hypothetical protein